MLLITLNGASTYSCWTPQQHVCVNACCSLPPEAVLKSATMPSRQLLIVSLVFACTGLRDAKSLKERVESRMGADPERPGSRGPPHRYAGSRPPQAVGQLSSWAYPKEPAAPVASMNPPMFQLRPPTTTRDNLAVRCGEDSVDVEVSQDLQGTGRLVQPDELTLGGCAATLADDSSQVLLFHSQLHGCNSKLIVC